MLKSVSTISGLSSPTFSGDVTLSTGNLVIGTAGKGIDFSADPSAAGMTSELLDDYEEGTWSGVISDGTNNATMNATECFYTKIGRQVTLTGIISTTALDSVSGTALRITGQPFVNGAKASAVCAGQASGLAITAGHVPTVSILAAEAIIRLFLFDNAIGTTPLQAAEWSDDGSITFSITYQTA